MPSHLIVLAAGQGSRMRSDLPKVLHRVGHAPLFVHALQAGAALDPDRRVLVAGVGADAVRAEAAEHDDGLTVVLQEEQLGTAHAVAQAREALKGATGDIFILYGDTPFIRPETLSMMAAARTGGAAVVVLGFEAADPGRYGRLVVEGGDLTRIVEYKDATEAEREITLCNSGVVCADATVLFDLIDAVGNDNTSGEYYLTDIVGIARDRGLRCAAVTCDEPHVVFGPYVTVESGATIRAFSHLEGCHVGARAVVGPYARLRPGAELGNDSKVGNFVEIKSAEIGEGAKVNHLTYIGDASIGEGANIGAGTVTCNYDGVFKHRTEIGARAFIGSSTMLVAPVRVGAEAMTGSSSVITQDVPDGALGLGRARQVVKEGLARKLMTKLRSAKSKRTN